MDRKAVTSSSLASVGYSPTQATLEVKFKHGAIYRYLDVPTDVFEAFLAADSKGAFFNEAVKDRYGSGPLTEQRSHSAPGASAKGALFGPFRTAVDLAIRPRRT